MDNEELIGVLFLALTILVPFMIGGFTYKRSFVLSCILSIVSIFIPIFVKESVDEKSASAFLGIGLFVAAIIAVFSTWGGRAAGQMFTEWRSRHYDKKL